MLLNKQNSTSTRIKRETEKYVLINSFHSHKNNTFQDVTLVFQESREANIAMKCVYSIIGVIIAIHSFCFPELSLLFLFLLRSTDNERYAMIIDTWEYLLRNLITIDCSQFKWMEIYLKCAWDNFKLNLFLGDSLDRWINWKRSLIIFYYLPVINGTGDREIDLKWFDWRY